eukprot:121809-Amphidinium_carterae.1
MSLRQRLPRSSQEKLLHHAVTTAGAQEAVPSAKLQGDLSASVQIEARRHAQPEPQPPNEGIPQKASAQHEQQPLG